jgi:hypothetical protein
MASAFPSGFCVAQKSSAPVARGPARSQVLRWRGPYSDEGRLGLCACLFVPSCATLG